MTDVVKSATTGPEWDALGGEGKRQHAAWWAPVLAIELQAGARVVLTVGDGAQTLLDHLTSEGHVPAIPVARLHLPHYSARPPRWPRPLLQATWAERLARAADLAR